MRPIFRRAFDLSALSLSGLCLAHCIALPIAAALLPALSSWANAEWVHAVFATFAVPITVAALWGGRKYAAPAGLEGIAGLGLALLVIGATGWFGKAADVPLTIGGATALAIAHTWNWRRHKKAHLLDVGPTAHHRGVGGPLPAEVH